jgi:EF hand
MKRLILAMALCFAAPAFAQTLDIDGDGAVSRAEMAAATLARFAAADANQDGALNSEELSAGFAEPGQLLYIVDADQDGVLNAEEWQGYTAGAVAIAFMLCDADKNDSLAGAEITCSQ